MIGLHHRPFCAVGLAIATAWMTALPRAIQAQVDPVVSRGVDFLKGSAGGGAGGGPGQTGEVALAALAMIKAEVPASDPSLARALATIFARFPNSTYQPERSGGSEIYEAAVITLALGSLDSITYRAEIESCAKYIGSKQNPNGSWDYTGRQAGDTSISQYGVLGLWEAETAGVQISPIIWDRAAQFFLTSQSGAGSWTYHRDEGGQETVSMTAAGVGSLLICERQLAPYRSAPRVVNQYLVPIDNESDRRRYTPEVPPKRVTQGIQAGIGWLAANFATGNDQIIGHSAFYALYGIERIGALADSTTLGRRDWFQDGRAYITSKQGPNGGFNSQYGAVPNTAWAVLFMTKSTAKTMRKIQLRKLGAGTLIGGRGLPRDLSSISVAGGHVIARPMDGAVEGMLAVLEDPRVEDAASALSGLIAKYRTDGPRALRPYQDRFRKLLTDQDQGIRRVAAWALARTGDLTMAQPLIDALKDPDEAVVDEARLSLQLLSRKIDGFGPPLGASPDQKEQAILKWRAWYDSVRPPMTAGDEPAAGKAAAPARRVP